MIEITPFYLFLAVFTVNGSRSKSNLPGKYNKIQQIKRTFT